MNLTVVMIFDNSGWVYYYKRDINSGYICCAGGPIPSWLSVEVHYVGWSDCEGLTWVGFWRC